MVCLLKLTHQQQPPFPFAAEVASLLSPSLAAASKPATGALIKAPTEATHEFLKSVDFSEASGSNRGLVDFNSRRTNKKTTKSYATTPRDAVK